MFLPIKKYKIVIIINNIITIIIILLLLSSFILVKRSGRSICGGWGCSCDDCTGGIDDKSGCAVGGNAKFCFSNFGLDSGDKYLKYRLPSYVIEPLGAIIPNDKPNPPHDCPQYINNG